MSPNPNHLSAPFTVADARNRVQNAILLAGLTMLFTFPTAFYQYQAAAGRIFTRTPTEAQLQLIALGQSIVIFGAAFVFSVVGFIYSDRLSLPGLGRWRSAPGWLGIGLLAGALLAWPSWWLTDRTLLQSAPELEPSVWYVSLARMGGIALTQEVIGRFGLMTIGVYLLRRFDLSASNRPAILAISAFAAAGVLITSSRLGLQPSASQLALAAGFSFAVNWTLGEVFLRRGLIAAVCLHVGLNLKLLVYSFILTGQ